MTRSTRHVAAGMAALVAALSMSAAPAHAASDLDTTGGGEFVLFLSYSQAPDPLTGVGCQPAAFTVSGGSQLLVVSVTSADSTGVFDYDGPVTITGTGSSSCEDASEALGGQMSLSLASANGPAGLDCPSLAGAYVRAGLAVLLELQGSCTLQGLQFQTSFLGAAAYEPLQGDGVLTPVTSASLDGAIAVTA